MAVSPRRVFPHLLGCSIILVGALVIVSNIRLSLAGDGVRRALASSVIQPLADPGSVSDIELLPLAEEAGDSAYLIEHGLAYLVRAGETTVLFDAGGNLKGAGQAPIQHNLAALGLTDSAVDALVLSHFHPDHIGGYSAWFGRTFDLRGLTAPLAYTPAELSHPTIETVYTAEPRVIAPGVATSGTLPFQEVFPLYVINARNEEQALAIQVAGRGVVLVVGCGHPGLQRLLERAEALFEAPIIGVVGGLHYGGKDAAALRGEIDLLRERDIELVALSPHDSGPEALAAFQVAFPDAYQEIRVGEAIRLDAGAE